MLTFPNVKLFDDLAVMVGLGNVKEKFLLSLGVRKTIELGVVFDRLLALDTKSPKKDTGNKPQWSHVDLIQYLASVRDDIPAADVQKLKNTPICPRHMKGEKEAESPKRYKVSELFEPRPELRDLGLSRLVLAWSISKQQSRRQIPCCAGSSYCSSASRTHRDHGECWDEGRPGLAR